jgi:serine/threonine protein kinase
MFLDIARGMEHVHSHGIIHRDLYVQNILAFEDSNGRTTFKVADFGQSKEEADPISVARGTCRRYAPEALEMKDSGPLYYKLASDVFMFAMVMWELAEATLPWPDLDTGAAASKTVKGERPTLTIAHHPGCQIDTDFKQLLEVCWHQDPSKRPTFSEVVQKLSLLLAKL